MSPPELPTSFTDVLIIGAGPSGLMAGQALARLGVKVRLIERRQKGTQYGNADGIYPRTLEVFKSYGLLDELLSCSAQLHSILMYKRGANGIERMTPEINFTVNTNHPFEATTSIERIEGILNDSMERSGVHVEQPFAPTAISISGDDHPNATHPVKVMVGHVKTSVVSKASDQGPTNDETVGASSVEDTSGPSLSHSLTATTDSSEVIYAKYVIGSDGAHSWVRRNFNIPMEGDQTEYAWGVMDASIETDFPDWRMKTVVETPVGSVMFIPRENKLVRLYTQLSASDLPRLPDGRLDKSKLNPEVAKQTVMKKLQRGLAPYAIEFKDVVWFTVFLVAQRLAPKYSVDNRVFISGDACHTHSPKAGQGANASMADTHNLAWKLAYVIKGLAKPSLLDTYEKERRPFAEDLLSFDKKLSEIMDRGSASSYIDLWRKWNLYFGGMAVQYHSALTDAHDQELAKGLTVGARLPPSPMMRLADWWPMDIEDLAPSDGLFKLLIFPGDILTPPNSFQLSDFSESLLALDGKVKNYSALLWIGTVLTGRKERLLWIDVPQGLRDIDRVFLDEVMRPTVRQGSVYETFGISPAGAAVLVRPDGYISFVAGVSSAGAERIAGFINGL